MSENRNERLLNPLLLGSGLQQDQAVFSVNRDVELLLNLLPVLTTASVPLWRSHVSLVLCTLFSFFRSVWFHFSFLTPRPLLCMHPSSPALIFVAAWLILSYGFTLNDSSFSVHELHRSHSDEHFPSRLSCFRGEIGFKHIQMLCIRGTWRVKLQLHLKLNHSWRLQSEAYLLNHPLWTLTALQSQHRATNHFNPPPVRRQSYFLFQHRQMFWLRAHPSSWRMWQLSSSWVRKYQTEIIFRVWWAPARGIPSTTQPRPQICSWAAVKQRRVQASHPRWADPADPHG